jgi:hypothetical protein
MVEKEKIWRQHPLLWFKSNLWKKKKLKNLQVCGVNLPQCLVVDVNTVADAVINTNAVTSTNAVTDISAGIHANIK